MSSDDEDTSPPPARRDQAGKHDDEDEFEFEQNFTDKKSTLKKTLDKPFDEVHEVSDSNDDSHASPSTSPTHKLAAGSKAPPPKAAAKSFEDDEDDDVSGVSASASLDSSMASPPPAASKSKKHKKDKKKESAPYQGKPGNVAQAASMAKAPKGGIEAKGGSSSEEESESDEEADQSTASAAGGAGGAGGVPSQAKAYNPADYKHLQVSSEISDLFAYILRHKPTDIELETKMKPFIPDYIPAVGEIDAFLKVPRPDRDPAEGNTVSDGKSAPAAKGQDALGLVVLDEPAAQQSDPTVLELSLRAVNKQVISRHATVGSIEYANRHTARVQKWIASIEEVHRKKPPQVVHYSRQMPDIEQLMQVWPPAFEELLKAQAAQPGGALPDVSAIDCDVAAFARMVCAVMDIPVYDKITESLHVLFTLYSEFQNHAYFQH